MSLWEPIEALSELTDERRWFGFIPFGHSIQYII